MSSRRSAYTTLFVAAVMTRLLVSVAAMIAFHIPLDRYTDKGDGESYKRYALVIRQKPTTFTRYDARVFPGYPLLIAGADVLGIDVPVAALTIDLLAVGIAAVAAAKLFDDLRMGWAMTLLIPHYVINSSLAMSEAPLSAFQLMGLLLAMRQGRPAAGGLLMGFAGLIRPMAAFAALGYFIWVWRQDDRRSAGRFAVAAAAVLAAGLFLVYSTFGDVLHGVRAYATEPGAYNGSIFSWPFSSLLLTPLNDPAARARIPQIATHVIVTLGACALSLHRLSRKADFVWLTTPWLLANTLFVLCIGGHWGFDHFPRFTIPAQAAMFFACERQLPRTRLTWCLIACVVIPMGIWGVNNSP